MKRIMKYLLILCLPILILSCALSSNSESGIVELTLPLFENISRSPTNEAQSFPQYVKTYEISIKKETSKGYVYSGIHKEGEKVLIEKIKPDTYILKVTGETDTGVFSGEKEIKVKAGKNTCTIDLSYSPKNINYYYVDSTVQKEGNGTKTYPFKNIQYALKSIPLSKTDVTLYLIGNFTEKIVIDETSRLNSLKIEGITRDGEKATINAKTVEGGRALYSECILEVKKSGCEVTIDNVTLNLNEDIIRNDNSPDGAVCVTMGTLTLLNTSINVALKNDNPPNLRPASNNVAVGEDGKLKIGGRIEFTPEANILLLGKQEVDTFDVTFTPISIVEDVISDFTLSIELKDPIKDPYPIILEAENNVDLKTNISNFALRPNYDNTVEYAIDENGRAYKTKSSLEIQTDENFNSCEIKINNTPYIIRNTPISANYKQTVGTRVNGDLVPVLLEIGKEYDIEVKLTKDTGEIINQTHKYKANDSDKDFIILHANTNKDWYVSDDPNSDDINSGTSLYPFKTLDRAFENIKEKTVNSTLVSEDNKPHIIHLVFTSDATSPIIETTTTYVIDYGAKIKIDSESTSGVVEIKNTMSNLFKINHEKAHLSIDSITLRGGEQRFADNNALICLLKGELELINSAVSAMDERSTTMNGIITHPNTTLTLTGKPFESEELTYNAHINAPIRVRYDSNIKLNYNNLRGNIIIFTGSTSFDKNPLFINGIGQGELVPAQTRTLNVYDNNSPNPQKFTVNPDGTLKLDTVPTM